MAKPDDPVDYCPRCRSDALVPGRFMAYDTPYAEPGLGFHAYNGKLIRSGMPTPIQQPVRACAKCGLIWSVIDPGILRSHLERDGDELTRQRLAAFDGGPLYDLPDCPEARVAGECVAEIDRLVWSQATLEATRRYRSYTGRTWDDTHVAIKAWPRLSRAEKLAHFGWETAEASGKGKKTKPIRSQHLMRDAELDG